MAVTMLVMFLGQEKLILMLWLRQCSSGHVSGVRMADLDVVAMRMLVMFLGQE